MITRAQAEALPTLAESLEACERLDVGLHSDMDHVILMGKGIFHYVGNPDAMSIRLAVNALIPKQET